MDCDRRFEEYLVTEVADAFVWASVRFAMIAHHDIESETPLSSDFIHNLSYYSRAISLGDSRATIPRILAESTNFVTSGTACATTASCGVDSLYSIRKYMSTELKEFRLTHLFLTTQGLFSQYRNPDSSREAIFRRGAEISEKLGLEFLLTKSNPGVFPQRFERAHTHSTLFSVLNLRKLFSKFMYPSGVDVTDFAIERALSIDAAYFDLLMAGVLCLPGFRVWSSGAEVTRLDKVRGIADYVPAKHHLSVCIRDGAKNCNLCIKCKRTLLELDAIGRLDDFSNVFDVRYYRENRRFYFRYLLENRFDPFMGPLFEYFSIHQPDAVIAARSLARSC